MALALGRLVASGWEWQFLEEGGAGLLTDGCCCFGTKECPSR